MLVEVIHHGFQKLVILRRAGIHTLESIQVLFYELEKLPVGKMRMGWVAGHTYLVVVAVLVGQFKTFGAEVLLHERVDDGLLTDCVAGNLPEQLVGPSLLCIRLSGVLDILLVVLVHLKARCNFAL